MKKVLSLVLVIAMVLSSFSFAFAANFEDVEGDYEEAVNVLTALGVVTGYEDGTFRPERIVTRAEMAKLIVEILGYGDLVSGAKSNFADTQGHWADPWIALAAGRGLVIGTGDGNFTPDRQVSYDEAITMVVRALGYTDDSNELKNMTWPTNFKVKASELDLLDGVKTLAGGADRGGVAQLLFNALEAILVTVDTDGNVVYVKDENKEDKPLLSRLAEKVDIDVVEGYADPDHKDYKGDVVDLYPYMYQNITVYEKDDVVVFVKGVNSLTFTGTVTAVTTGSITIEDANEDEFTFKTSDVEDFMYNNEGVSSYNESVLEADEAQVTVVLEGEDGDKIKDNIEVLAVVATQASGYVRVEDVYEEDELTLDAIYLPKDGKVVDADNLVIKGDADSLEDIEEDDVLAVFVPLKKGDDKYFETSAANKMTIIVARNTVEGRLTKISGKDYYIDGKAYGVNSFGVYNDLEAGDEGLFFLDHEGNIFDFDEEGSGKPGNYALVLDTTNGYRTTTGGGVVLADPKVKLLTASGEEITYVIDFDDNEDVQTVIKEVGQNIIVDLAEGNLVEYDLNSSKEIDELKLATGDQETDLKTDVNSFNLANNAVIFNLPGGTFVGTANVKGDVDDADVITVDDLDDEIDAFRVRDDKGKIVALVVTEGGAEVDEIFAMITKDNGKAYDEDREKEVKLFTAYVDGIKVEYLAHKDEDDKVSASTDIVELKLSSGKLKAVEAVTDSAIKTGKAGTGRVTNSITTVPDEADKTETYFLSDDVVVYVLKWDDGVKVFDKVGAKSDIRGKNFTIYDVVDDDKDFDIVVVWADADESEDPDPVEAGEVTYIDATNDLIYVDNEAYQIGDNTLLKTAKGSIIAKGFTNIDAALAVNDEVASIVVKDGVVETFVATKIASIDVSAVDTAIEALPAVEDVVLGDKAAVDAAKASYDALTPAEKDFVKAANVTKLNALVAEIADLQAEADAAADQLAADAVDTEIEALPAVADATLANEGAINTAKANFDALTDAQEALVKAANVTKLNDLLDKMVTLNAEADVAADKAALTVGFNGTDTANDVTEDLTLDAAGASGNTTITWSSSNTALVANDGTVTQPNGANVQVTLTATITSDDDASVVDTKIFVVTVTGI